MDEYDNFANAVCANLYALDAMAQMHTICRKFSPIEVEGYVYSDGFLSPEGWHESDAMLRERIKSSMNGK